MARGSGQPQDIGDTFLELQKDMTMAAKQAQMSYRITDLDYEAIAITPGNALGTYVSAGQAYSFGKSVASGVKELKYYAQERTTACPNTYWVLAGYSQGAMVIQDSLGAFDLNRIVYVMYFGDPKLYLPEGEGFNPPACRGDSLSEYRVNVPDCGTDNGILGARNPYQYPGLEGRYGLWCNDDDFICGSSKSPWNTGGHSLYEENGSIYNASIYALKNLKDLRRTGSVTKSRGADADLQNSENEEQLSGVMARLSQIQYRIDSGSLITFDASRSFSVDGEPLKYSWYIDGKLQNATGPSFSYIFRGEDPYKVRVVVSDGLGSNSEAEATVFVDYVIETAPYSPAYADIHAERCGEKRVCVSWTRRRGIGRYLGVRFNDYFLGYVDVANEELVIDDVDFSNAKLAMGAVGINSYVGGMEDVQIEGTEEPVPTSALLPWWRILVIVALPFGFLLLIKVAIRLARDLARAKQ